MPRSPASSAPQRVLIVEDEATIRRGLADVLRFRGCDVEVAEDGETGLHRGLEGGWDLVVLDIMLPELNGFAVCQQIREAGLQFPVLMLTAKDEEDDIVHGFEVGANDYVTKPFGVRELAARVDALLRRSVRRPPAVFHAGALEVHVDHGEARVEDKRYPLTEREILILRALAEEPGKIVGRRTLLRDAWGMNNVEQLETRTVDVHIAKLRRKLESHGEMIATVRGQGYRLCS